MTTIGPLLGEGRRSEVRLLSDGRAFKMLRGDTPVSWLDDEVQHLVAVGRAGAPCPHDPEIIEVDGQVGMATECIDGPSMWCTLHEEPSLAAGFGHLLADLQLEVFSCRTSFALPMQGARIVAKLHTVAATHGLDVDALVAWLPQRGSLGLCHGDLHPMNVLLSSNGPVLVDWFDACVGHLAGEVARTQVFLASVSDVFPDLDDATLRAFADLASGYFERIRAVGDLDEADLDRWRTVQFVARIAEGISEHRVPEARDRVAAW